MIYILSRITVLAMLLFLSINGCTSRTSGLGPIINDYGYLELIPPSQKVPPGSIIYVIKKDPYEVTIICEDKDALGKGFRPLDSTSKNSVLTSKVKETMKLDLQYFDTLKANAQFENIQEITANLFNVTVPEVTDTLIRKHVVERDPDCAEMIQKRIENGYSLTMVSTVLKADVVYGVTFKKEATLSAQAKKDIIEGLAAGLSATASTATDKTIKGSGLYWGIKDDSYLLSIAAQSITPHAQQQPTSVPPSPVSGGKSAAPVMLPGGATSQFVKILSDPIAIAQAERDPKALAQLSRGDLKPKYASNEKCLGKLQWGDKAQQESWLATTTGPGKCTVTEVANSEKERVSHFITANYAQLSHDIARGEGEYLESYARLLGIAKEDQPEFFKWTQSKYPQISERLLVQRDTTF